MNDFRITLTQRAKDDIINIDDYITFTLLEPDTSKNLIKDLRNSISQLKLFPYKFPLVQDDILQRQDIRSLPHTQSLYTLGIRTITVNLSPSKAASAVPPICSANFFTMARPSPVVFRLLDWSVV